MNVVYSVYNKGYGQFQGARENTVRHHSFGACVKTLGF